MSFLLCPSHVTALHNYSSPLPVQDLYYKLFYLVKISWPANGFWPPRTITPWRKNKCLLFPTFQWIPGLPNNILFNRALDFDASDFVLSNTCSWMIERQLTQLQNWILNLMPTIAALHLTKTQSYGCGVPGDQTSLSLVNLPPPPSCCCFLSVPFFLIFLSFVLLFSFQIPVCISLFYLLFSWLDYSCSCFCSF